MDKLPADLVTEGATMRDGVVPAHWTNFYELTHIPAAVWDGDRLYVTGHTGEDPDGSFSADPEMQIRQTFRHIGATLSEGGTSWAHVMEINSYHVGLRAQAEILIAIAGEFLSDPYPAWTAVGVTELFDDEVEISCVATVQ
jgi:enamine deaminase RidA (YjgF/YER057c/UK114 family)